MTEQLSYTEFLESKFHFSQSHGFDIAPDSIHPLLKPHQRDLVQWAVKRGRAAIFAAFGLGKTIIQIEILRAINAGGALAKLHNGRARCLIIAPLGVRLEFMRDAEMLSLDIKFVRRTEEVGDDWLYLTNYESVRDGKLDVNLFFAVSLDEASVLRSYGSKTYQTFLTLFSDVPYRFVATATPSPNRHKELIHYAGYLGIMDTGQALTRFFQRDSTKANNLTLYPHMEREFYAWLHSWAIFLQRPSDLGYSDEGYDLPPIQVHYHELAPKSLGGKVNKDGQVQLINNAAIGLKDAAHEKRESIYLRVEKMLKIVKRDKKAHYLIWHDLEAERHAIQKALPKAKDVYGSQDMDEREQRIMDFADGKFQYLSTKPEIAGSGCNFQRHCSKAIFLGIGYKFNDFIQAIHRVHRFLQTQPVEIHVIYMESERSVLDVLKEKWTEDEALRGKMSDIIKENGLACTGLESELKRSIGVAPMADAGEHFHVVNNDTVQQCSLYKENSIDLILTSIPFGNHYEYTSSYNDFGHNDDNVRFFAQMDYLTPNLLRILRPGRMAAIHVKDRIRFGNVTGYGCPTVDPFHADCIAHYRRHGFLYMGMITVVTDVVRENNQTYRLGWSEQCKDGSKMGVGSPEYVLLLRKLPTDTSKAYADVRVEKSKAEYSRSRWQIDAHAFWRSNGDRFLHPDEVAQLSPEAIARIFQKWTLENLYDHEQHVALGEALDFRGALPATFMSLAPASHAPDVWHDVNRMRTLNGEQTQHGLVNHICPLQFDIVDRIIRRYTNKGDVVLDPFAGLMTVPYRAILMERFGMGVELNADYYRDGLRYLRAAEQKRNAPSLFDALKDEAEYPPTSETENQQPVNS